MTKKPTAIIFTAHKGERKRVRDIRVRALAIKLVGSDMFAVNFNLVTRVTTIFFE